MSEAAFNNIQMPLNNPEVVEAHEDISAADYDYSKINNYSDLSYDYLNLNVTMKYKISESLAYKLGLDYHSLTDNKTYVYGDETGAFYVIKTGFMYGL